MQLLFCRGSSVASQYQHFTESPKQRMQTHSRRKLFVQKGENLGVRHSPEMLVSPLLFGVGVGLG